MAARPHPPNATARLLAVALSALAIAVAGCGESKQESYRKGVQAVNRDLGQLGRVVFRGLVSARGKTNPQFRREFSGYANRLHKIQGDLDRLDPPSRLAREQDALVRAIGQLQRSLRGVADLAAGKATVTAARRALNGLFITSAAVKRARERLTRDAAKNG
jgi:hypothetical protein